MTAQAGPARREALRLHVTGVVQGVGFRPFVHRLAVSHGLTGSVRNTAGDVEIEVEGSPEALHSYQAALAADPPPLARIAAVRAVPVPPRGASTFTIEASVDRPGGRQAVSPDAATCTACEAELHDPRNRRFEHPFITCTDCGPRFTVIEAMPYDRARTSMRAFSQCPDCAAEYRTPGDRRHHSETNACPECGPRLWFERAGALDGEPSGLEPIAAAAAVLRGGGVVAVRGLGGFHLAVDAADESAVQRLRARKGRDAKPLAVMVRTTEEARALGMVDGSEAALLASTARPIVLIRRRPDAPLAPSVAPGLAEVGVMLAYTPLHHLLLARVSGPLVMTSGNASEEPIATGNGEARKRLAGIADAFLLHDREIVARYDDSVARVVRGSPVLLRRARGYAPLPLPLPDPSPRPLLAVGAHLKNTFTLAERRTAFVSQHVGDLETLEGLAHFDEALHRFRRLFRIDPEAVVRDLHPGYLSSAVADEMGLGAPLAVQHHHAHIAAVMAEHGVTEPVVGVAYDGTGLGEDGQVWGSEILVADLAGYRRVGRLRYAPLAGGDLAARRPWRAALGYLSLDPPAELAFHLAFKGVLEEERWVASRQLAEGVNAPLASSMGRLFDAAAAVLGLRNVSRYEGQAAMELEALAGTRNTAPLPFPASRTDAGGWVLDPLPLLSALGRGRRKGGDPGMLAAAFHEAVAEATVEVASRAAAASGIRRVALGGGVFQNARLLASISQRLAWRGLEVLTPRALPPNDGAISYGQAAVAARLLSDGRAPETLLREDLTCA
jgi:hydrogenase maturation protein HypF